MASTSVQDESLDSPTRLPSSSSWKDRLPIGLRRASAPDGGLKAASTRNASISSNISGTTLHSEPVPGRLVHSNSMPSPSSKDEPYTLSRAGVRIQTSKANLSSGFPYANALYELRVSPDSWSSFSEEIVKATRLSIAQKSLIIGASVGVGLGTGILSSSYLSVLGVAPAMIAGKVIYDKQVTRKVKQGLQSTDEGGLESILRKWNEEVFISRGFFVVMEVPKEADKKEKAREAAEKQEAKLKEKELREQEEEEKSKEKALLKEAQKLLKQQQKAEKKLKKENAKLEATASTPGEEEDTSKQLFDEEAGMSEHEAESSPTTTRDLQDSPTANKKDKKKKKEKYKSRFQVVLLPTSVLPSANMSQLSFIHTAYEPVLTGSGEREDYYKLHEPVEYYPVEPVGDPVPLLDSKAGYADPVPLLDSTPCPTPDLGGTSPVEARSRVVSEIYTSPVNGFYNVDENSQSTFFPTPRMSTITLTDNDTVLSFMPNTIPETAEPGEPVELPTPDELSPVATEKNKRRWTDRFSRKKKDVLPQGLAVDMQG